MTSSPLPSKSPTTSPVGWAGSLASAASGAAVTSSAPASSHSASRRGNRSGIRYMTNATASGGRSGLRLTAVAAAPPKRRRKYRDRDNRGACPIRNPAQVRRLPEDEGVRQRHQCRDRAIDPDPVRRPQSLRQRRAELVHIPTVTRSSRVRVVPGTDAVSCTQDQRTTPRYVLWPDVIRRSPRHRSSHNQPDENAATGLDEER